MHFLTIFLLLGGSAEGSAVTGNPIRPFTAEDEIKAVISQLEDALIDKDEVLVTACLSPDISSRKAEEVKSTFTRHVANTQAPSGKPLVSLQEIKVEVDGERAVATLTAYSYGDGKRIKAIHKIPFRHGDQGWYIDDAVSVTSVLAQVGGIAPQQQRLQPEEDVFPDENITPVVPIETTPIEEKTPSLKVIPVDPTVIEHNKEVNEKPKAEPTRTSESTTSEETTIPK
ncbi:hypothetical protein JXM67_08940 [candidate division WOR-3 bacterium]|nr:hypothetical protein [candidate division WOR-3 bacterium]